MGEKYKDQKKKPRENQIYQNINAIRKIIKVIQTKI